MEIIPPPMSLPGLIDPGLGSDPSRLTASLLAKAGRNPEDPALTEASREFEAYFITHLLQTMRKTIPEGLLPNKGGEFFRSFYDQEIGRLAAQAGGLGLAAHLEEHLAELAVGHPLKEGLKSYAIASDTEAEVTSSVPGSSRGTIGPEE